MSNPPSPRLPHLTAAGTAHMVDVSEKTPSIRRASARGKVTCAPNTLAALRSGTVPKGDVLAVARVAAIAAVKQVPQLLPLAHVIGVHGCEVDLEITPGAVEIAVSVTTADRTGVEMEALTGVTVCALAIVDMLKGIDRSVAIRDCRVVAKSGGRSGAWIRPEDAPTEAAPPAGQAHAPE